MADGPGGEKTEKATPKRRDEARKEGQVAKSQEVNSALAILAGFAVLLFWGPAMIGEITDYIKYVIRETSGVSAGSASLGEVAAEGLRVSLRSVAPFFGVMLVTGVVANLIQVKFKVTPEVLKPRPKRINPINGAKQKFSPQQFIELLKNLFKLAVVAVPAGILLWSREEQVLALTGMDAAYIALYLGKLVILLGLIVGTIYIFVGVVDWFWQKYRYEKQIKMTKYEVKQELRQQDMSPEMKSQQRRRAREAARSRMLAEVPDADVVITNPTHFSVALRYDADDGAPLVVAKGQDLLALRIREIADEHGVMRVENRPLARALYADVEVGQFIPGDLFAAVAEVLAFVYRHQADRRRRFEQSRPLSRSNRAGVQHG